MKEFVLWWHISIASKNGLLTFEEKPGKLSWLRPVIQLAGKWNSCDRQVAFPEGWIPSQLSLFLTQRVSLEQPDIRIEGRMCWTRGIFCIVHDVAFSCIRRHNLEVLSHMRIAPAGEDQTTTENAIHTQPHPEPTTPP